jgi:hypothetical protein
MGFDNQIAMIHVGFATKNIKFSINGPCKSVAISIVFVISALKIFKNFFSKSPILVLFAGYWSLTFKSSLQKRYSSLSISMTINHKIIANKCSSISLLFSTNSMKSPLLTKTIEEKT